MTTELYTPEWIIDRVVLSIGPIELDPASCFIANQTVRAARHYTRSLNGLLIPWKATTVFVNPPYARECNEDWAQKIEWEWRRGEIGVMCALIQDSSGAAWFKPYLHHWRVLIKGRVTDFYGPDDKGYPARFNSLLVFYGVSPIHLVEVWGDVGYVMPPVWCPNGLDQSDEYRGTLKAPSLQLDLGLPVDAS